MVLTTITIIASLKALRHRGEHDRRPSNSTVLGFEMVNQQQRFQSYGHSSALAVVLFLFMVPLIVYNVRNLRKQRGGAVMAAVDHDAATSTAKARAASPRGPPQARGRGAQAP